MNKINYDSDSEKSLKREPIGIFVLEREILNENEMVRFSEKIDVGLYGYHDYCYMVCPDKIYGKSLEITYNNIPDTEEAFISSKQFADELVKEVNKSSFKSLFAEYMEQYVTFDKVIDDEEKLSVLMDDFRETEEMILQRLNVNKERTFSDLQFLPKGKLEHIVPENERPHIVPTKGKVSVKINTNAYFKRREKQAELDTKNFPNER